MAGINFDERDKKMGARIVVVGAGGGGGNAVDNMVLKGLDGVEFIAANTDVQALERSRADEKIQLGKRLTDGLGAGADPQRGKEAATEDQARLDELFQGCDMVFVTAGMGGGTGSGAAPVIARCAREAGALTVGVVTKPFFFEGRPRMRNAEQGIAELANHVDSLIVMPNDRLLELSNEPMSVVDSFKIADNVLHDAVRAISDLIVVPGLVNVDFADAKRIMQGKGKTIMGIGEASGEGRAEEAAERAMSSQLLEETSIEGATGILVNISGGQDLKIQEIHAAMTRIQECADESAEVIMGCVVDPEMNDKIRITLIATGFETSLDYAGKMKNAAEAGMETAHPRGHESRQPERKRGMLAGNRTASTGTNPPPIPAPRAEKVGAYNRPNRFETHKVIDEPALDPSRPEDWF